MLKSKGIIPVMHIGFNVMQREDKNIHQIYLYDDVEEYGQFDWKTWSYTESESSAAYFRDKLNEIPDGEEIELFINSRGGSVKEGTAIFNLLKRKNSKITGYVDGVAHSIAFVILQGCNHRVMGEGTSALIHEMWVSCVGNADELRQQADQLDNWMKSSRSLFMSRAKNITEEELQELMKAETILTPDQALEYGFVDEIAGEAKGSEDNKNDGLQQMKQKFNNMASFEENAREFAELVNDETKDEEEQEAGTKDENLLGAFFNAFM